MIFLKDPASWATLTFTRRLGPIIDKVISRLEPGHEKKERILSLKASVTSLSGRVPGLSGFHPYAEEFNALVPCAEIGACELWGDCSYLFAEVLFYALLWDVAGAEGLDYFAGVKREGLEAARPSVHALFGAAPPPGPSPALFHTILWGNRADLSLFSPDQVFSTDHGSQERWVVVDDSERAWERCMRAGGGARPVIVVLDNAGLELGCDLFFAWVMLSRGVPVILHCKPYPYFVSDATVKDVVEAIDDLPVSVAEAMRSHLSSGLLSVRDHPVWVLPAPFAAPVCAGGIRSQLADHDPLLVVFKGDLNYRRLDADATLEEGLERNCMATFSFPYVAVRTFKSETITGVWDIKDRLASNKDMLTSGRFGLIQFVGENENES